MVDITDRFIKSIKEKINQPITLSLPEEVLEVTPIHQWNTALFVGHEKELESISNEVSNCLKGYFKKIILHGKGGIGKSSLATVVAVASDKTDLSYKSLVMNKEAYLHGSDFCYGLIVAYLCHYIKKVSPEEAREMGGAKVHAKYGDLIEAISNEKFKKTTKDIVDYALTTKVFEVKPEDNRSPEMILIDELAKKLKNHKILLVLDDFEMLIQEENKVLLQNIKNIIKIKDFFSILILHTDTYNDLKKNQDELIKDASSIEVLPLTRGELKQLIWRRLLYYPNEEDIDFDKRVPNFSVDLRPFDDGAVNLFADASNGNPLSFIKLLSAGIALANDRNMPSVTEDLAKIVIGIRMKVPENLSLIQKQILEFIRTKGEVTIEEVRGYQGKSRIAAYFILRDLYRLDILAKKRKGREMLYFIKRENVTF